jgi:hypothetical protein
MADAGLLKRTCSGDEDALKLLDLIDEAEKNKDGNPTGANQYQSGTVSIVHSSTRPAGNTRQRALRKLRTGRPDLHAKVLANQYQSGTVYNINSSKVVPLIISTTPHARACVLVSAFYAEFGEFAELAFAFRFFRNFRKISETSAALISRLVCRRA